MDLDITKTTCFTGHRPNVFLTQGNYRDLTQVQTKIKSLLTNAILAHISYGVVNFISGGAVGVDQWAAECILNLKKIHSELKLIIAKPFPSQHIRWPAHVQNEFHCLLNQADEVINVSDDPYAPWKMHVRNEYMVNHSEYLIAVKYTDIVSGGTASCLQYAIRKDRKICTIDPREENISYNY